jgi:hypothetical protein
MVAGRSASGLAPDTALERNTEIQMLDYARQRAIKALRAARTTVLATTGPDGVQASEFPCEAIDLDLYLLVPQTSDHLFNLEQDGRVALVTDGWELRGKGRALSRGEEPSELSLLHAAGAELHVLVKVEASQIQIRRQDGWGPAETIDVGASR